MNKNAHFTHKELLNYIYNEKNSNELIKKIENHIIINKCSVCKRKLDELNEFKDLVMSTEPDNSIDFEFCPESDKIDDFVLKKLSKSDEEAFITHISTCDDCREGVAVLVSTDALSELEPALKNFENIWVSFKDGIQKLKNNIEVSLNKGFINEEYLLVSSGVYRDGEKDRYLSVELPDNCANLKVYYNRESDRNGKINIEFDNAEKDLLVEIFDEDELLLKCVETNQDVSCSVNRGIYKIVIEEKYEIDFDIAE